MNKWLINLTDVTIPNNIEEILGLSSNFGIRVSPKKIPVPIGTDITYRWISNLEYGLLQIPSPALKNCQLSLIKNNQIIRNKFIYHTQSYLINIHFQSRLN